MLTAVDDLDVVSFVIGILALLIALGVPVMHLVVGRLPPGRLKQIDEALAEARAHLQLLVNSGKIADKKAENVLSSLAKLDRRRDDLWLEVDQWKVLGYKRFVHPTLNELLRSCSDLLRRIAVVREGLRPPHSQTQTSPAGCVDCWHRNPFSSIQLDTSLATSSSLTETLSELSSPLPSIGSVPWNAVELNVLARPSNSYHPRVRLLQNSRPTPDSTGPSSSAAASESTRTCIQASPGSFSAISAPISESALDPKPTAQDTHIQSHSAVEGQEAGDTPSTDGSWTSFTSAQLVEDSALRSAPTKRGVQAQHPMPEEADGTTSTETDPSSSSGTASRPRTPEMTWIPDSTLAVHASGVERSRIHGPGSLWRARRHLAVEDPDSRPKLGKDEDGSDVWLTGPDKGFKCPEWYNLVEILLMIRKGEDLEGLTAKYGARQVEQIKNLGSNQAVKCWEHYPWNRSTQQ